MFEIKNWEDVSIIRKRPLAKQNDAIKNTEFIKKSGINPNNIILFEPSLSESQLHHVECVLTGRNTALCDSAYKSHRKGYVYSDKVHVFANRIKTECVSPKVCAIISPSKKKITKNIGTTISELDVDPRTKYLFHCVASVKDGHQRVLKDFYHTSDNFDTIKELGLQTIAKRGCLTGSIKEINKNWHIDVETKDFPSDQIKYVTYKT